MADRVTLNDDQKEAFIALKKFVNNSIADTFLLKGYAGTGKTFLMQYFAKYLSDHKHKFSLLASTGRAATVLRGKTGITTRTVHGELYHFTGVDGAELELPEDAPIDQHGQMTLLFAIRKPDQEKNIYIIDESSMLAGEIKDNSSTVFFGSGNLMDDLFSAVGDNKVIFVGDPGQLPPVHELFSPALDLDWLNRQNRKAVCVTLGKIERTSAGNDILKLAQAVRDLSKSQDLPTYPRLPARNLQQVFVHASDGDLFEQYLKRFRSKGSDGVIAVARSNRMVDRINKAVRKALFGDPDASLVVGDILLVVQNNYAVPLTNGDFVSVATLGEKSVYAGLYFQSVTIKALLSNTEFTMLLSLDILYGGEPNFTKEQSRMLMIDFTNRMRRKNVAPNSPRYRELMMEDPYLNCLRAKFGYAVTCHKAQGGEWNEVYLFLEKSMYAMPRSEMFRWWYTAITRAKEHLHLSDRWWIR